MSKSPPQHGVAILYAIAIAAIALDALTFFVTFPVGAALRVVVHSLVALLRHVALPLAVVGSAAWRFRDPILARCVAWLEANKGVRVAAPTVDAAFDARRRTGSVRVAGVAVALPESETPVVALDEFRLSYAEASGADAVLEGLTITFVAYDARFKDTNVSRLLGKLGGGAGAPPKKKRATKTSSSPKFSARVVGGVVHVLAAGPLGVRPLVPPIALDDETVDSDVLASKFKFAAWLNALVLRTLSGSSLDAVAGAFSAVGGGVVKGVDVVFSGVDAVADRVPGGFAVKRGTGAASAVVGGTVGGATKVVGGVGGGLKSIFRGLTSGSAKGAAAGLKDAGKSVAGGVADGGRAAGAGASGARESLVGSSSRR